MVAGSRAPSKVTLNELLDTLRLLEEEPELLPPPKLLKKDRYAWTDRVSWGMRLLCPSLHSDGCLVRNSRALPGKVVEELGGRDGGIWRRRWRSVEVVEELFGALRAWMFAQAAHAKAGGGTGFSPEDQAGYWGAVMETSQHLFSRAFPWVLIHHGEFPAGAQLQLPDC